MDRYQEAFIGGDFAAIREDEPAGLKQASDQVLKLFNAVKLHAAVPSTRIVLGGFSQGAMVATEAAMRLDGDSDAIAALVVFSGALLHEKAWRRLARSKPAGLYVLQSHGKDDLVLPYEVGKWLRDFLKEAQFDLEFVPFRGGHEVSAEALSLFGKLLSALGS